MASDSSAFIASQSANAMIASTCSQLRLQGRASLPLPCGARIISGSAGSSSRRLGAWERRPHRRRDRRTRPGSPARRCARTRTGRPRGSAARRWSPPAARSRYWSMARFSGRAPISGEKPFSSRNSMRRGLPLHGPFAVLEAAPLEHARSAPSSGSRASARASAAGTRSPCRGGSGTRAGRSGRSRAAPGRSVKPSSPRREAEARGAMAGGAEVGGEDDDAVAEIGDLPRLASVSRPSSNTCRNRSQTLACAFSNSSSSTTENGCLRTR